MTKPELEKLAEKYQAKADRAFQFYQETGMQRYDRERQNNEDLADDIADAKAVRRLWPYAKRAEKTESSGMCVLVRGANGDFAGGSWDIFRSLKPGENLDLDEILEEENG